MAAERATASGLVSVPEGPTNLPEGWSWKRLDSVCDGVFDCPHSTPMLTDTGPFVVLTQDIITGIFRPERAARVSAETYSQRIARATPQRGDLLYSREGTYFGIAAEVPEGTPLCLGQRMVLIRPDGQQLDFRFLRHWLNSPTMARFIHGFRDGSVAERLNLPTIRALPVLTPPLGEQRSIAAALGALEDKIELNRRMNATLEAIARALFQSWFVDFDPVRAKLDGRTPFGLDAATAATSLPRSKSPRRGLFRGIGAKRRWATSSRSWIRKEFRYPDDSVKGGRARIRTMEPHRSWTSSTPFSSTASMCLLVRTAQ
jgi:type I restriction enzyme S subunit